jgi:xylulokinase
VSLLALDIGSSRIKASLASWDGAPLELRSAATPRQTTRPGEQAYPADGVYAAAEALVSSMARSHPDDAIDTIVFSCLGTAMVPIDGAGRPLGAALAPADTRPARAAPLADRLGLDEATLRQVTGSDPERPSALLHALWWDAAHPDVAQRLRRWRSLRGYILTRLCHADAEDPSWASRTMLVDLEVSTWSERILEAAAIQPEVLPPIAPSTTSWSVEPQAGRDFGLAAGAVAVLGGMDNCCSQLGAVAPESGHLVNIVGTYEHLAGTADLATVRATAAAADAIVHAYILPGLYTSMTRVPIGELLTRIAGDEPGELDGLLAGVSPEPRGATVGLDAEAISERLASGMSRTRLVQAVLESSATLLARFAEAWESRLGTPVDIRVGGGGASHVALLQLKANVMGRPIDRLASDECACLGAMRLAAMAVRGASVAEACQLFPNPVLDSVDPQAGVAIPHPGGRRGPVLGGAPRGH